MTIFSTYKKQYAMNLRLAGPIVLSHAGQIVVQLIDNAMVGRLGAAPLAGVAFGGVVFWALFIVCMGITFGLTPLVGEMYSKGSHRLSANFLQNSILLYALMSIVALAAQLSLVPLMKHLGQQPEVLEQAVPYYRYMVWSVIPFMLYAAFKQFLEGVGNTTATMFIVLGANVVNIFFNWLLIYGNWGFPMMGAGGAGLATLISRATMPVAVIIYFASKDRFRRYFSFFSWANFSFGRVRSLVSVGFPIAMQMFMENGAFVFTTIMMGWIGTVALAASQTALIIANLAFMVIVGISSATTIRVSHEYGRGNLRELKRAADASYHISLMWNLLTATVFIALRKYIPLIFTDDPEVISVASTLLIFVAAFQISDGLQAVSIGILRGMQDVKSIMRIAFFSYIVVNIPIAYLCGFTLGWGPGGLWAGFVFGVSVAAVLLISRYRRHYRALRRAAS